MIDRMPFRPQANRRWSETAGPAIPWADTKAALLFHAEHADRGRKQEPAEQKDGGSLKEGRRSAMNPISRSFRAIAVLTGSYAALTFLYVLPVDGLLMQHRTSSVFYFVFAACITLYFAVRIIDQRVRKNLICVGAMIVLWCILRAAKYIASQGLPGICTTSPC